MANIHGIEVAGETYDIEDTNARQGVETNANDIDGIEGKIPASASSTNKLATQNDLPQSALQSDINITLNSQSTATVAKFSNVIKYGNIVFATISIDNLANSNLGGTSLVIIGSCNLRPVKEISVVALESKKNVPVRLFISVSGNVIVAESTGVVSGSNAIRGELILVVQ